MAHYGFGGIANNGRVCVCEGIFDALRIGPGAFSILGTNISPTHYAFLKKAHEILLWFDNPLHDKAGAKATAHGLNIFPNAKAISYKEPGDCYPGNKVLELVKKWLSE